jgi:hypothetical protein
MLKNLYKILLNIVFEMENPGVCGKTAGTVPFGWCKVVSGFVNRATPGKMYNLYI